MQGALILLLGSASFASCFLAFAVCGLRRCPRFPYTLCLVTYETFSSDSTGEAHTKTLLD